MIQVGTNLHVADNSGARLVQCVKLLRQPKKRLGRVAAMLVVSVKSLVRKQKAKVKKGHLYKAIVCETASRVHRLDGSSFVCARNTSILLSRVQMQPVASRIAGITPYELRVRGKSKLLSLSMANV